MELLTFLVDFIVHIDVHLDEIVRGFGGWTYAILFLIVFCETGLVVTPFLPGDSLLFAAGAIAARNDTLNPLLLALVLFVAAVLGDAVNYAIGHFFGPRILQRGESRLIKRSHIERTEKFYERYGGKTIIFARFVPIVRTFAPFLAGIGSMRYTRFAAYNVIGGFLWVFGFLYAGVWFGELPAVRKNFTLVIFAIIVLSVLPAVIELFRGWREAQREKQAEGLVPNNQS